MIPSGKSLPEYEDVFADMLNGLLMNGKPVYSATDLCPCLEDPAPEGDVTFRKDQHNCCRLLVKETLPRRTLLFRFVWTGTIDREISHRVMISESQDYGVQVSHHDNADLIRAEMEKRGVPGLTLEELRSATPEQIRNLSRDQIRTLTPEQIDALTDLQYRAMTREQREILDDVADWRYPVITPVLYFGQERWDRVLSTRELYTENHAPGSVAMALASFQPDIRASVIDVSHLPLETVERFHTDFRFVAEYFIRRANGQPCTLPPGRPAQTPGGLPHHAVRADGGSPVPARLSGSFPGSRSLTRQPQDGRSIPASCPACRPFSPRSCRSRNRTPISSSRSAFRPSGRRTGETARVPPSGTGPHRKDVTAMPASGKSLPEYEDVFTEIVNTLLFHSVPVVRESRLHPFPEDPAVGLFNPFKEGQFTCSRIMIRERPPRRTGFFRLVWTAAIDPEISFHVYDCFALDNTLQYDHNCEVELIREEMAKRGVSHPTTEQLLAATPEQIRNLSRNELRTLTQEQMNALTDAQYQALSEEQRKVLDDVEEWNFHAITPVLYFGKERWEKVRSSAELWMEQLTDIDSPLALAPMQQNARAAVYDISHLPPETLERFHTDFRFVAEYFVCRANGQPCTLPRDDQLRHPEAFRTMMYQLTEDPQFLPA